MYVLYIIIQKYQYNIFSLFFENLCQESWLCFYKWSIPDTHHFQDSEYTYHDKSVLVPMMIRHEAGYLRSKVYDSYEEEKYRHHESATMRSCPLGKSWVIRIQVLGLENRKSSDNGDKEEGEYTWLWDTSDEFRGCFWEPFLEHIERCEEDDKESCPLDTWVFHEETSYPTRCNNHKYDRDDESYHEVYDISMARSCNRKDIIEWHDDISNDDHLERFKECIGISSMFIMMFTRAYLTVELPYNVEEEYCPEELESWDFEEEYDSEWKYNTEDSSSCHSPEYCFSAECRRELFGGHTDEDGIITTHHDIDEDDIEKGKESCTTPK